MDLTKGRLTVDFENGRVVFEDGNEREEHGIGDPQAFDLVSAAWLRSGWDTKYVYTFTWFGRPIIQLPEDVLRMQEAVYNVKPDVLVETGVAHGGSLTFYASLFEAMHRGRVIGVDIEIRPHNRAAIESHELFHRIELIEGSSVDPQIVSAVRSKIREGERVMVVLDSNHSRTHVAAELEAYAEIVSVDSYIVATDGIMKDLEGAPRSQAGWASENPHQAALEFVQRHPEFVMEQPPWAFNESTGLANNVTYWPGAWLRRIR